jgi:hypothetical protein
MTREEPRESENMPALPAKFNLDEPLIPQSVNGQITAPVLMTPEAAAAPPPQPPVAEASDDDNEDLPVGDND